MNWDLAEAIGYYQKQGAPGDQNALVGLLKEIQAEYGAIPPRFLPRITETYRIKESLLHALIRRIPGLRLADTHCLELCCGAACRKHTALAALADTIALENVVIRHVPCMRMCGKGPNIRWDGQIYHHADETLLRRLLTEQK